MTIAQAKAARRKSRQDLRWHTRTGDGKYQPRKSKTYAGFLNKSQKFAAARGRKRVQAGGRAGSIGFHR